MRRLSIILVLLSFLSALQAEDVKFTASAPATVVVGAPFQLVYTVNDKGKDLRIADMSDFEILAGPYMATSSTTQFVNGKMSSSKSISYTYTISAKKEGSFVIPAATIVVDKKQYRSNAVSVKSIPEDKSRQSSQSSGNSQVQTSNSITADNLFIRAVASKTRVMEQEAFVVSYKAYSKVELQNITNVQFPDFKDCLVQDLDVRPDADLEHYNGSNYRTYELKRVLLFPQKPGTLTIDRMKCTAEVAVYSQSRSRSFFSGFYDVQIVEKQLSTQALKIVVEPLPAPKPADFSSAVGRFSIESSASSTDVKQNDAITIRIKISGSGNLKILKTPELRFPADFETYEPKVNNQFTTNSDGMSGYKEFEYLVIPRHNGSFSIPPVSFSYFDLDSKRYKSLSTKAFSINVAKGDGVADSGLVASFKDQEEVSNLGSDIRYLMRKRGVQRADEEFFAGSLLFWFAYLIPAIISSLLLVLFRKQARENANAALVRNKKANKVALRRLKQANVLCKAGKKQEFYQEILRALWGYLSDKLSIPTADLSKENVASQLGGRAVPEADTTQFMSLLNECEFQQYAPLSDTQTAMDNIYKETIAVISALEESIK